MKIIDSHIHCGIQNVSQPFSVIEPLLDQAGIEQACLFAPVEDIYDRYSPGFEDNHTWRTCRQKAHEYLLSLSVSNRKVIPYYFAWNDFDIDDLDGGFKGIKWHHHLGEPEYRYDDSRCIEFIDEICSRKLPILLEETFDRTLWFVKQVAARTSIIIPHTGLLNGGFNRLVASGIWEEETVYADTALAGRSELYSFLYQYGPDRLIFGSDWPFGDPQDQFRRLLAMEIDDSDLKRICSKNIEKLIK